MNGRKLTLAIDDLEVTTFVVSSQDENGGTIQGQEDDSNGLTCFSRCWSFCPGETDCCPETHTECDPTSCYGWTCNGSVTCLDC
jgi:hypothetical protein